MLLEDFTTYHSLLPSVIILSIGTTFGFHKRAVFVEVTELHAIRSIVTASSQDNLLLCSFDISLCSSL